MGHKGLEARMKPSVYGVGYLGGNLELKTSYNGKKCPIYNAWLRMLERCYSKKLHERFPSYIGCEVSDYFKNFSNFYEWCQDQLGFNCDDYELDKDLLIKGNKIYSESTCVFIPSEINLLLTKSTASRGQHLIGVYWSNTNKAFVATVRKNKEKREHLGLFNTELEAFDAYKTAKESFIKEQAEKWKGKIDPRAYEALMKYEVSSDD